MSEAEESKVPDATESRLSDELNIDALPPPASGTEPAGLSTSSPKIYPSGSNLPEETSAQNATLDSSPLISAPENNPNNAATSTSEGTPVTATASSTVPAASTTTSTSPKANTISPITNPTDTSSAPPPQTTTPISLTPVPGNQGSGHSMSAPPPSESVSGPVKQESVTGVPSSQIPASINVQDIPPPTYIDRAKPVNNEDRRLIQTHAIVIPSYASWFTLTQIHEVEKRSLPEFSTTVTALKPATFISDIEISWLILIG